MLSVAVRQVSSLVRQARETGYEPLVRQVVSVRQIVTVRQVARGTLIVAVRPAVFACFLGARDTLTVAVRQVAVRHRGNARGMQSVAVR